jgi:hypothetical protein
VTSRICELADRERASLVNAKIGQCQARAAVDRTKHVALLSREEDARLARMGGENGGAATGRLGQAVVELLPRRTRRAPIEI